jgi:hypothetical protein
MPPSVQVGAILMKEWPEMTPLLGLESEPCSGEWSLLKALDGFALDRKIHAAGWNFFFMAAEVRVMFFGSVGTAKIQKALKRILEKVRQHQFNSLEVTEIVARRFLGVPYAAELLPRQSCSTADVGTRRGMGQRLSVARSGNGR